MIKKKTFKTAMANYTRKRLQQLLLVDLCCLPLHQGYPLPQLLLVDLRRLALQERQRLQQTSLQQLRC